MRLKGVLTAVLLLIMINAAAQEYQKQVGVRLGQLNGISLRMIKAHRTALEATFGHYNNGFLIRCNGYRYISRDNFDDKFQMYLGGGLQLGAVFHDYRDDWYSRANKSDFSGPVTGFAGALGFEFRPVNSDFIVGITYEPFLEYGLIRHFRVDMFNFGLHVRLDY